MMQMDVAALLERDGISGSKKQAASNLISRKLDPAPESVA
jgi:hypothetical protein